MPAKNLYRTAEKGIYSHIYNKGVEKRIIFNDEQDYVVFLGYLEDYLTASKNSQTIKKDFKVRGRTFQGIPHLPKNYFNDVELIAYSLMPDHFHLVLHQKTRGSIEHFLRSLCTRYSMYFNKKYKHSGPLFEGPYKSVQIKDQPSLLHLTDYLHHTGSYSSYAEYLGLRVTSWIKPKKGTAYKDFVEKYVFDQKENELIGGITIDSETEHLERRDLIRAASAEEIPPDLNLKPLQRIPEFLAAAAIFLLLVTIGIRNITLSTNQSPIPSPPPSVLSQTKEIEDIKAQEIKPKIILTIDGATRVNIRQKPTTNSKKIGEAKDGDILEFVSEDSGWYGVKLADGSTGFILATYIKKGETNN